MSLKTDYDSLKRLHESSDMMLVDLQEKNRLLLEENTLLLKKLVDCQKALEINKEIMCNALTEQNRIKDEYSNEINILRAKIKNNG